MPYFHKYAMIRTGTYRHSNTKSPQRWHSRINQHIVFLENRFHVFYVSSVMKIAIKGLRVKL